MVEKPDKIGAMDADLIKGYLETAIRSYINPGEWERANATWEAEEGTLKKMQFPK